MSAEMIGADVLAERQELVLDMMRNGVTEDLVRKAGHVIGWQEDGMVGHDDIIQVTAFRAYENAEKFDAAIGDPMGYTYRIAQNAIIDTARRRAVRPQADVMASRTLNAPETLSDIRLDVLPPTGDHASDVDNRMVVNDLLSQLSDEHRVAISSIHLRGLSVAEAAAELGVAEGTLKSRAHYGMRQLRKILLDQGVEHFSDL